MMIRRKSLLLPIIFPMAMLLASCVVYADPQSPPEQSTNTRHDSDFFTIVMLTPNEGVDFSAFMDRLLAFVRLNWFANLPQAAKMGIKGKVVLHLRLEKDGTLDGAPMIETSSGTKTLDDAAVVAIVKSAPLLTFPEKFKGSNVEFRATFLYNVPQSKR